MSRYWSGSVAAIAFAVTAGLGAQGQNPANTPPPDAAAPAGVQRAPVSPSAQTRTETVTISGCLQNAPAVAARGAAADSPAAGAVARPQFILSSAAVTSTAKPGQAVGTAGSAATTYQLQGDATMLSPHLNKKVEITGAVQSGSASATGAANAAPGSAAAGPTLRVESVKMLTETCDAGAAKTPAPASPAAPAAPPQP